MPVVLFPSPPTLWPSSCRHPLIVTTLCCHQSSPSLYRPPRCSPFPSLPLLLTLCRFFSLFVALLPYCNTRISRNHSIESAHQKPRRSSHREDENAHSDEETRKGVCFKRCAYKLRESIEFCLRVLDHGRLRHCDNGDLARRGR